MYSCPFCDQELSTEVERDRRIVDKHSGAILRRKEERRRHASATGGR